MGGARPAAGDHQRGRPALSTSKNTTATCTPPTALASPRVLRRFGFVRKLQRLRLVGLRDLLRTAANLPQDAARANPHAGAPPVSVGTPWGSEHPHHLESVVWADVAGIANTGPATRAQAMAVPAIARARNLIVPTIASWPLRALRGADPLDIRWLDRSDGLSSPFLRMCHTVDDLMFYGVSLWALARDVDGQVIRAAHVPFGRWTSDQNAIFVDNERAEPRDVAVIPGYHEGILNYGAGTIRHARHLIRNADKAVENPVAYIELHQESERPLTEPEIEALIARWVKARQGENGGVAYTNRGIKVNEHGAPIEHLLVEGRTAAAVDTARMVGIPATFVDVVQSGSSVTYESTEGRMAELTAFSLAPYMQAIAARLGQDDIVPRGTRIEFDTSTGAVSLPKPVSVPDDGTPPSPAAGANDPEVQQ